LCRRKFWDLLLEIDHDLAAEARARRCACGGALHAANYPRKPRGGPAGLGREHGVRLSLCCAVDGCRRRTTPESVRFLGRRVFVAGVVVLVAALVEGATGRRLAVLRRLFGVSRLTLARWREWWREVFPATAFWQAERGRFVPPPAAAELPGGLIGRFSALGGRPALIALLSFLAPVGLGPAAAVRLARGAS
jgi:hypothetical protein